MFTGYILEEQAGDYPEGYYERAVQTAAEAGNQGELDALFSRRSTKETLKLALFLLGLFLFLTLFFAPVYVPLGLLRGWIHAVAVVNPVTRLLEAGRGFLAGSPTEVGYAFLAAAALAVAFSLWALRGLQKAEAAGGA